MRSFLLAVVLSSACATTTTGPQHANIPAIRHEIDGQIAAEHGDRKIESMGKVLPDRAVVYTTSTTGNRQEETWVKANGQWKLQAATALK